MFEDVMESGIDLTDTQGYSIPDYLTIDTIQHITLSDHIDPSSLQPSTAYVYEDSIYLTDNAGNIAFVDCQLCRVKNTGEIRKNHPEYRSVGGKNVKHKDMDAGHFGLSLGQHPSIAMEQDSIMNRFGVWRSFERYWARLLDEGKSVHIIAVFVEGEDTYSPFWCIHEDVDGDISEYVMTNDDDQ